MLLGGGASARTVKLPAAGPGSQKNNMTKRTVHNAVV